MHKSYVNCFLFLLVFPAFVSCQEFSDPNSILKKAILAHGGKENLEKPRKGILKANTKIGNVNVKQEEVFDLPKRWKRTIIREIDGEQKSTFTLMVDRKIWEWKDDKVPQEIARKSKPHSYFAFVTKLLEFAENKTKLTALKDIQVMDKIAVGFRVIFDKTVTDTYFDKKTGLLNQMSFSRSDPEIADGKEFKFRMIFWEYKLVDGIQLPYRYTFSIMNEDSDLLASDEFNITEIRMLDKIAEGVFALPK